MIVQEFLDMATQQLRAAEIPSARLDCLILLEDVLGKDRALLLAHPEMPIPQVQIDKLNKFIIQRKRHIPLAYIRGRVAFFGRDFTVNTQVLVPRPESEIMIEMLLHTDLPQHPHIADIGTGSGCLGITAALELPHADVYLYDIEPGALDVAKQNARIHNVAVHAELRDLLTDTPISFDVLLANLPYVPDTYPINTAVSHEPVIALFAGADGLDAYRRLWHQISDLASRPAHIFTESLPEQHHLLESIAGAAGYTCIDSQGLIQHFTPA